MNHKLTRVLTLSLLIFCALTTAAQAQRKRSKPDPLKPAKPPQISFESGRSAVGIPFEFLGNIILVKARINDSAPLKFIFDTGAGITVINELRAKNLGLQPKSKVEVNGIGGSLNGVLLKEVALSLGGARVTSQVTAGLTFSTFPCEMQDIDGVIGYDFIKEFVVELDYKAQTISLFDPQSYTYTGRGETIPLTITRTPRARASLTLAGQRSAEGLFEIDTGSDGTLSVNTPFVKRHALLKALNRRRESKSRGVGGKSANVQARVETFQLGSFVLKDPVVSFSVASKGAETKEDNDGPLGNEVLRRFKVTIDYTRQHMMLEPNESLSEPFEEEMSGIDFETGGAGCKTITVESVTPNSPASEAGILTGDVIQAIDGRTVETFTTTELEEIFRREGVEHTLVLSRGKQRMFQVKFKTRRLI
ncbi:MAG: aspartyl protease family protein [Acidobacteria bacterium]|nr:aspartyl protease family protein [Acidobacteriota bacterium]